MKKNIIIIISIFFTALLFGDVKLDRIAVIDIQLVMENVFSGKSGVIQGIKRERKEMQQKLDQIKSNIMKLEELKLKETDRNRKLAYDERINKLKQDYSDYYKVKNYQIQEKVKNIQGPLLKEVYNAVKKIADAEGYSLVLDINTDGIFYYTVDIDITQKTIDFFNKKYGEEEQVQ